VPSSQRSSSSSVSCIKNIAQDQLMSQYIVPDGALST